MAWKGVITNGGNELLTQWTSGKTLIITRAAAGTGRVSEIAMLAQTALVSEKQAASILSNTVVDNGQRLRLQVSPLDAAYALNQFGVFAHLDGGDETMIALFQTDTDSGIEIPSSEEVPDFVYTFYGLLAFSNTGGELAVTFDSNAYVTQEQLKEALNSAGKPATTETLGRVIIGENLVVTEDGAVSVDTAEVVGRGDTRPVTAGAVYNSATALEEKVLALETQFSYAEKDISDLKTANAALQQEVSEMEAEILANQNEISELNSQIADLQIAEQEIYDRLAKLENALVYPKSMT